MEMTVFDALGERVAMRYERANYDEVALSRIAAEELEATDLPALDLEALTTFVTRGAVMQRPDETFGDLPAIVFSRPHFYIQLLVWNHSTTSIHEHAFSGAFRVLAGSSIHARYRFNPAKALNANLLVGEAKLQDVELLDRGSVRPITAGHDAAMHSLFHLEQPSATVVVRNYSVVSAQPQYALAKPHFAYASHVLNRDTKLGMLKRGISVLRDVDSARCREYMLSVVPTLDVTSIFGLRAELDAAFTGTPLEEAFFDALRDTHGEFSGLLRDVLSASRSERTIIGARALTTDPELRFFLAVLLSAPTREASLALIARRFPDVHAEKKAAALLARLADPDALLASMIEQRSRAASAQSEFNLLQRLTQLFPKDKGLIRAMSDGLVSGADCDWSELAERSQGRYGDAAALEATVEAIRRMPALSAVFR